MVGFKYSKNYLDTSLSSKKALVASLVNQGSQLSNAYDVYTMQFNATPSDEQNLSQANVKILTQTPDTITEIGSGWDLNTSIDIDGAGVNDIAFTFAVTAADPADAQFCAVLNNMYDNTVDFNTTVFPKATYAGNEAFCYGTSGTDQAPYLMVFTKTLK